MPEKRRLSLSFSLAQREQRLQRQKDTLEMAVSRDDAEAPNRGDPAFQERQDGRRRQIDDLQRQLTALVGEKQAIQNEINEHAYQRLAELKSRQAKLMGEKSAIGKDDMRKGTMTAVHWCRGCIKRLVSIFRQLLPHRENTAIRMP